MRECLYVISNTQTTFEAQFIKKLCNTKAELKKSVAYKKKACNQNFLNFFLARVSIFFSFSMSIWA